MDEQISHQANRNPEERRAEGGVRGPQDQGWSRPGPRCQGAWALWALERWRGPFPAF